MGRDYQGVWLGGFIREDDGVELSGSMVGWNYQGGWWGEIIRKDGGEE